MGRLSLMIECKMALTAWGDKAKYRQGRVGLSRDRSTIHLVAVFPCNFQIHKFEIHERSMTVLPAAIRLKEIQRDLFIKEAIDTEGLKDLLRIIKVLLRRDLIRRNGKGSKLDRLILDIPLFDENSLRDQGPIRSSTTVVGRNYKNQNHHNQIQTETGLSGLGVTATVLDHYDTEDIERRLEKYPNLKSIRTIGIRSIPEKLWLADSLNRLALIECNLKIVPKQLETLSRSLEFLDLSKNSINKLPRTFCCKMNSLRYLNLSNNLIEMLPLEIKFFSRLVDLDLSNNRLRLLPSTFSDLRSLKTLNVANNDLSQLPAFRKEDIRLDILDISNNPLDGALDRISTFEIYPSFDNGLGYEETTFSPFNNTNLPTDTTHVPTLFETAMLNIVRCDFLFKLASEESLPKTVVSTMQRDIFKCYRCNKMSMLPAYNSTDFLDYVDQVRDLITSLNYRPGMTFMKLLCRKCFGQTN